MPRKTASERNATRAAHRPSNPTPPDGYPGLKQILRVRERVNLAALCRQAGVSYGNVKSCIQYEREPSSDVYIPLRKAFEALGRDLRNDTASA